MEPNLANVRCKQILLKKLTYAVISSVLSQIIVLVFFLFAVNFSLIHPKEWIRLTLDVVLSASTWLFIILFTIIVFNQSVICAKDYVLQSAYYSTRFQKFFHILSVRNFVLLALHVVVGGLHVWLYVSLSGLYDSAPFDCKGESCVRRQHVFLVFSGLFTGFNFFVGVYIKDKKLEFPVIQQRKLLHLKGNVLPLLDNSRRKSMAPTFYFIFFYYIWGGSLKDFITSAFGLNVTQNSVGFLTYFYAWLLGAIYFFNMNLMRFFFNMFLTEAIEFPLEKSGDVLTLQEAITSDNLPLIQHLACLDLYTLSFWSSARRQVLFSLSHPGCHPYNWNSLIENVLKLFGEYIDLLNKSIDIITTGPQKPKSEPVIAKPLVTFQSPLRAPGKYPHLRNMSLRLAEPPEMVSLSNTSSSPPQEPPTSKIKEKLNTILTNVRKRLGYNYLFDELPETNIQKYLGYGQIIIWTSQGIAGIAAASFVEDKFGVVQKQLPLLITTLARLKTATDRLNTVPAFSRHYGRNNYNYKMRMAVSSAVKRSLVNIGRTFGEYFEDMPLTKDVQQQLLVFVPSRSG